MNYKLIADSLKKSFLIRKKKSLLLTAVATLGLAAATMAQNVPSYVPTNGLVGWWPFNGNANDESGNGNNGNNQNNVNFIQDRFGNNSAALDFPNFNSKIWIPFDLLGPLPCSLDHSFSFWVKLYNQPNVNGNQQSIAFCNGRLPGQSGINAFGNWYYLFPNNVSEGAWYDRSQTRSLDSISTNIWHLMTYVYTNTNNRIKVYIDGVDNTDYNYPNVDQSWSGNCTAPNPPFGNYYVGNSPYDNAKFNGNIDDLGVWNRALTQQEITDLYNGCQLTVNTQPNSQTININNNAQFIVGSSDPSAAFQWQTDLGVGFQNLNSVGQYSGTTNDTLNVANVTLGNNNQSFRCIISTGSCSDTSNVAVLNVNNNVGINEFTQGNLFSVFPSPAQTVINIKADSKIVGDSYSVIDNTGRIILSGKIASENSIIELGSLSNGVYMFNVGNNMKQQFKILKQ